MESFQKRWLPPFAIDCGAIAKLEGREYLKINKKTHDKYVWVLSKMTIWVILFIIIYIIVFLYIFRPIGNFCSYYFKLIYWQA